MRNCKLNLNRQTGVVLVLSLLILLVLTIIGVAAMNSTMMQERMAGNTRTQTLTFEEASGGVSRALDFFYENIDEIDTGHDWGLACGFVHGEEDSDWAYPTNGDFELIDTGNGGALQLEQRMYCCQNYSVAQLDDGTDICIENPSKLFVLNRGSFMTDEGRLAMREVEVRLDESDPEDPTCAICLPGGVSGFDAPNSGALQVHGSCGPAITTETEDAANVVRDAVSNAKPDNFHGGIVSGDMGSPWNDPVRLAEFVFWAKLGLHEGNTSNTEVGGYFPEASYNFTGNPTFGTEANPALTYFAGDVDFGGTPRGHGILIVRGELDFNGTPRFNGLIVSMGGGFTVGGGGGGGNPEGSFVATSLLAPVPGPGPMDAPDLLGREALRYRVAEDPSNPGFVEMYNDRAVLLDNADNRIRFRERDNWGIPTFEDVDGNVIDHAHDALTNDMILTHNDGTVTRLEYLNNPALRPRDRFGRLMPDFVLAPQIDGERRLYWPPEEYGYNPNEWDWDPPGSPPFEFGDSQLSWSGGGNQTFTYDCRLLQKLRHHFFCEDKVVSTDDFPPEDYDFQEPDHALACNHPLPDEPYNDDIEVLNSGMNNHHAWHLWMPRCDCLGITGDTDMILAGWRENLGWRDEEEFQGCASLTREARCPGL